MKSLRTSLFALACLALAGFAGTLSAEPPHPIPGTPKPKDTAAPLQPPRRYFLEGDSLNEERIQKEIKRTREETQRLFEQAQQQMAQETKKLRVVVGQIPPVPGEVVLPDTVYTTEVTIGPEGIEYYDSAGVRQVIQGRPVSPDVPFVFSEESGRALTSKSASSIVQVGVDVHIARDERVDGDVVAIGGNIEVEGEVKGDVVAVLGNVTVDGYVHGSAVAPMGKVQIGPTGRVRKDVVASVIDDQPGSLIGGRKDYSGVRLPAGINFIRGFTFMYVMLHLGLAVFTIFLILLGHVFAAKNIAAIRERISTNGIKSFVIGLLAQFLGIPILFVLLLITVIGIPVAILVLPIAVVVAMVLGFAAFGLMLGEKVANNTGFHLPTQLGKTIAGVAAVLLIVVFGALLVLTFHTPLSVVGWIVFGIGHAIVFIAITTGLGAVVLTRFGTHPKKTPAAPTVAPVPIAPHSLPPPASESFPAPT